MARTIRAVLFDFGGVFTESPFDTVQSLAGGLGAEPAQLLEIVFGPYHEDTDHPWHRLERGEVTLVEARDAILALGERVGVEADLFHFLRAMAESGRGGPREAVVSCARRLRREGLRTALVTNNAREFRDAWRPVLPLAELFDAVVDSSEVGMRKPNPAIYEHALERVGGPLPGEAVFLDDFEGNVLAARRLGMHGVLVGRDPEPALRELESLLGPA